MKRSLVVFIILSIFVTLIPGIAFADQEEVVSLGANLTAKQQDQMLDLFGVTKDEVKVIQVTNQEERDYLKGLVSDKQIGTRAISSAYVKIMPKGNGINVKTHNITWVTNEMYANAMVTAGLEDAEVYAAAPFRVSGTAALTGIMKGFEEATGKKLTEEAKKTANEELVLTGDLGNQIGKDEAAALIQKVKEQVAKQNIKSPEDIKKVIINIAAELNINLTDAQINQIMELMKKISQLNLNVETISKQLGKIGASLDQVKKTVEENKGIIQKIFDAINSFFRWLQGIFNK